MAVEILDFGNLCGGHGGSVCMWIYGRRNGSAYFRIGMNISLSLFHKKEILSKRKSRPSPTPIPRESWYRKNYCLSLIQMIQKGLS
jgi:hypothetical protein